MASFYQYETKDLNIYLRDKGGETLAERPLEGWKKVVVSLGQTQREKVALTASSGGEPDDGIAIDVDNDLISVRISQEQSGKFSTGECQVQVNIYFEDEERDTSAQGTVEVKGNLHRRVIDG